MSESGLLAGIDHSGHNVAWPSTADSTNPIALAGSDTLGNAEVSTVTSAGAILGVFWDSSDRVRPLVWMSPTAQPNAVDVGSYIGVQVVGSTALGELVGSGEAAPTDSKVLLWQSATSAPSVVPCGTFGGCRPIAVATSGEIVGTGFGPYGQQSVLLWPTPTQAPTVLTAPGGRRLLAVQGMSKSGTVFGTTVTSSGATVAFEYAP